MLTSRNADRAPTEAIVKDAISGAAVSAFARGIALAVHVDHRLPATISGQVAAVTDYLRQGLLRTVEAGRTGTIALALWRIEGETGPAVELEVGRSISPEAPPAARLADLWSAPLAGLRAAPVPRRRDARGETVTIPLPLAPDPEHGHGTPAVGDAWRPAFQGRSMLHVGELLLDTGRFCASLKSIGLDVEMVATAEEALRTAGARADAQRPFDILLIHEMPLEAAEELARAFRADPRLAGTLITFAGVGQEEAPRLGEVALFDAVRSPARPWRRLIGMMRDLLEARQHGAAPRSGEGPVVPTAARPGEAGIPDLGGRRILIAEDVETNQVLLRAFLEPTGATIQVVPDGAAAIERHSADPVDLILMDLQMPGIDGITAARRIRDLPPPASAVPIVALTAYAASPDRQRALAAGMDAYLAKPVVMSELHELVRRLLRSGEDTG